MAGTRTRARRSGVGMASLTRRDYLKRTLAVQRRRMTRTHSSPGASHVHAEPRSGRPLRDSRPRQEPRLHAPRGADTGPGDGGHHDHLQRRPERPLRPVPGPHGGPSGLVPDPGRCSRRARAAGAPSRSPSSWTTRSSSAASRRSSPGRPRTSSTPRGKARSNSSGDWSRSTTSASWVCPRPWVGPWAPKTRGRARRRCSC